MKIKAGIVGATGYAGAELVRLLYRSSRGWNFGNQLCFLWGWQAERCLSVLYIFERYGLWKSGRCCWKERCYLCRSSTRSFTGACRKVHWCGQGIHRPRRWLPPWKRRRIHRMVRRNFLDKNFTNRPFTDFLNFSEIKSRAKSLLQIRVVTQPVHRLQLLLQL